MKELKIIIKITIILLILSFFIPRVKAVENVSTIYLLGDSRFVGMNSVDDIENHKYYAKVGKGYDYLELYYNQIKNNLTENDFIIINYGINDLGNINKYIDFVNEISSKTPAKIIYMTVNPVNEYIESQSGYSIKNETVNDFNKKLAENLNSNIYIVDTNTYLTDNGFSTGDGIHYTQDTYKDILLYIDLYLDNFEH